MLFRSFKHIWGDNSPPSKKQSRDREGVVSRDKTMNRTTTETQPINEVEKLLAILSAHGVLSVIFRTEECKEIIVKLGLTTPIGEDKCLLCGNDGRGCIYLFACERDPDRNNGRLQITGYRFDVDQYKCRPVKGIPDAWTAFRYCAMALAHTEGLDATKCCFETAHPIQN